MELRQLRYFMVLAQTCHFGQAAELLHVAQPPLSRAIRNLEEDLGVQLFSRTTRQVTLTRAGEVLREECDVLLTRLDQSVDRVRAFADGRAGRLRLGLTGSASYGHLPQIARILTEQLPGVDLDIHTEMLTPAQEQALLDGTLDLGILRLEVASRDLATRVIAHEPLVVALPPGHRFAHDPGLQLSDLRDDDFITYDVGSRSVVSAAGKRSCRRAGFTPRVVREVHQTSTALALVAAGLGVCLLPASARVGAPMGVVFADVPGMEGVTLAAAWRADSTDPLLHRVLTVLEEGGLFPAIGPETPTVPAPLEVVS